MSGICGVITWDDDPAKAGWLERMLAATPHRGATIERWNGDGIAVAVQGRSSATPGHLAVDAPSGLTVALDGRLDNRSDLSERLRGDLAAPEPSDADLTLAAVRRWGPAAWAQLVGDFACIAWDHRRRRLLAACDMMGMRPLYLRSEPGRLVFASEIAQLLQVLDASPSINERSIARYLLGERTADRETAYAGIEQLVAGTWLSVDDAGATRAGAWSLQPLRSLRYRRDADYAEHFARVFQEAVVDRMRPHGSVGIMLSGGLDSGAVAASAGRARAECRIDTSTQITALSWAFDDLRECDERRISRHIVAHYDLCPIDVPADDAWPLRNYPAHGPDAAWPRVEVFQPLVDRTLDAAAATGAQTVLTGDRGDEVAGGWIHGHVGMLSAGAWAALGREIAVEAQATGAGLLHAGGRLLVGPLARRLRNEMSQRGALPPWLPPHMAAHGEGAAGGQGESGAGGRRDRILAPFTFARAAQLNLRFARAGVEYADPWSDRRLAEFVLAVPPHLVNRLAEPKRLVRQAMRGVMPEPARLAAQKIEPHALFDRGFRDREQATLRELTTNMEAAARGFVDEEAVRREVDAYLAGEEPRNDWWRPVSVEMWLRAHWPQVGDAR